MVGDDRDLHDSDLHDRFRAVRRKEEANIPPFSTASPNGRRHLPRQLSGEFAAVAACLVTIVGTVVWLMPGYRISHEVLNREPHRAAPSITSWKPETDFLLDTPGREILGRMPIIGEWHSVTISPSATESRRQSKK